MKVRDVTIAASTAALLALAAPALAHTPLFACYDMGGGAVLCEGGFSDGSSAAGVPVHVLDGGGEVVLEGEMNANSEFEFEPPEGTYSVRFDAGEGHRIEVADDDIF
jgi:hypothetical protein